MTLAKRNYDPNARGTLEGVRVLDLSRLVAGNQLTQVLGDYGAEVIKIEPPAGDTLRAWQTKGVPINWKVYARNKKSLGLELRTKEARDILLEARENYDEARYEGRGPGNVAIIVEALDHMKARHELPDTGSVRDDLVELVRQVCAHVATPAGIYAGPPLRDRPAHFEIALL